MNNTFENRFREMKNNNFTEEQVKKGYHIIRHIQKPGIFFKILWEIITTIIVFAPSVNNYTYSIVYSIRDKWSTLSDNDQINVIAALSRMNRSGKIDRILDRLGN